MQDIIISFSLLCFIQGGKKICESEPIQNIKILSPKVFSKEMCRVLHILVFAIQSSDSDF